MTLVEEEEGAHAIWVGPPCASSSVKAEVKLSGSKVICDTSSTSEVVGIVIVAHVCVYAFSLKISNTGRQTTTRLQSATNRNMHNKQTKKETVSKQDKELEMFTQ